MIPHKTGSFGNGISMVCRALAVIRVHPHPQPQVLAPTHHPGEQAAGWRWANGFWIGSVLAAVVWEAGAGELAGYPVHFNTAWCAVAPSVVHVSEWFSFA